MKGTPTRREARRLQSILPRGMEETREGFGDPGVGMGTPPAMPRGPGSVCSCCVQEGPAQSPCLSWRKPL